MGRARAFSAKVVMLRGKPTGQVVRGLAICPAVISLLFLISCPSAFAGGRHGFSIKVFTSPDDQFWVNSVIIEGAHKVMLVDAQLTKTSAENVLQQIKETEKPLSIALSKLDDNFIKFEDSKIEVFKNVQGDTGENTMFFEDELN